MLLRVSTTRCQLSVDQVGDEWSEDERKLSYSTIVGKPFLRGTLCYCEAQNKNHEEMDDGRNSENKGSEGRELDSNGSSTRKI